MDHEDGAHPDGFVIDTLDEAAFANEVCQAERQAIARELHDTVIQPLTSLAMSFEAVQSQALPPGMLEAYLGAWRELAREALDSLRGALAGLRTHPHAELGLPEALRRYLAPHLRSHGIRLSLDDRDWPTDLPLDLTSALYLAIREALTNVEKHAHASEASVWMHGSAKRLNIIISDDGVGLRAEDLVLSTRHHDGSGFGLTGMRERMNALGGQMSYGSAPGHGTYIELLVPYEPVPPTSFPPHYAEQGAVARLEKLVH